MMFLDFFKPSTWLSGVNSGIMGTITTALRTLFYWINTFIYGLIINLYEFFDMMCEARLLDNVAMNEISQRVGLILGLVMFFVIIFSFIKMLIDPDKVTDKEMGAGSIIKKVIIVIVMLGASNFVFQSLYKIQTVIVDGNVISKLILPYEVEDGQMENFGKILSMQLMSAFYQLEDLDNNTNISYDQNDQTITDKISNCNNMHELFLEDIQFNGRFELGYTCLNESIDVTMNNNVSNPSDQVYLINFNGIFATLAGAVVVYMLFMYCFGVGIRLIQLTFLEIIAPMAIISYISPKKDNMFAKWWKLYFATYIDIFIRVGIISFVAFLIMTLFSTNSVDGRFIFWDSFGNITTAQKSFLTVIIVLALLTFAKKAPELIKELFPASASKIGFGMKMKDVVGVQKGFKMGTGILGGTIGGAVGGAAIGLLGGGIGGFAGGLFRGGLSGLKGKGLTKTAASAWKAQTKMNKTMADVKANGGTAFGYHMSQLHQNIGSRTEYENLESVYSDAKQYKDAFSAAKKKADGEVDKFAANYYYEDAFGNSYSLLQLDKMRTDSDHYTTDEMEKWDYIYNKIHGFARDQAMDKNGAIKSGSMVWKNNNTSADYKLHNWKDVEENHRSDNYTVKDDLSYNTEIAANMQYVLDSDKAKSSSKTTNIDKAKEANDHYEGFVDNKINDEKYKRAKANAGK